MSENCNHNCSDCAKDCQDRTDKQSFLIEQNAKSNIKKVFGIVSGKGGVGKSLVTSLLAIGMNNRGKKVAVLDADITGPSIPRILGTDDAAEDDGDFLFPVSSKGNIKVMSVNILIEDETKPVVWRGPVIAGTVKQFWSEVAWGDVDYMFVDMPPGTGDVPLTVFQSLPLDGIIIVTSPQELVGMIVAKAVNMADMMNIPIVGIVQNMAYFTCPNCNEKHYIFGNTDIDTIAGNYGIETVAQIPIDPQMALLCDKGELESFKTEFLNSILDRIE